MVQTKTYAKIVTAEAEYEMTHRQFDELRMLLSVALDTDGLPNADPPVMRRNYQNLEEWLSENAGTGEYLGDYHNH
jgi:hypothetical protein